MGHHEPQQHYMKKVDSPACVLSVMSSIKIVTMFSTVRLHMLPMLELLQSKSSSLRNGKGSHTPEFLLLPSFLIVFISDTIAAIVDEDPYLDSSLLEAVHRINVSLVTVLYLLISSLKSGLSSFKRPFWLGKSKKAPCNLDEKSFIGACLNYSHNVWCARSAFVAETDQI